MIVGRGAGTGKHMCRGRSKFQDEQYDGGRVFIPYSDRTT